MSDFTRLLNKVMRAEVEELEFQFSCPTVFQSFTDPEGYKRDLAEWEAERERRWHLKPHTYGPHLSETMPEHLWPDNLWWWLQEEYE